MTYIHIDDCGVKCDERSVKKFTKLVLSTLAYEKVKVITLMEFV